MVDGVIIRPAIFAVAVLSMAISNESTVSVTIELHSIKHAFTCARLETLCPRVLKQVARNSASVIPTTTPSATTGSALTVDDTLATYLRS